MELGRLGEDRLARQGQARMGRFGGARQKHGRQGLSRRGRARSAKAGTGTAGESGTVWHGMARPGRHGIFYFKNTFMYKFKNGDSFCGVDDAWLVGQALEQIREKHNGMLKPSDVVDEARDPKHVCHPMFTWDDHIAAEMFRREEARFLIRNIVIIKDDKEVPAFLNVKIIDEEEKKRQYYQNVEVMNSDEFQSALNDAKRDLAQSLEKLEVVKTLAPVTKRDSIQMAINDVERGHVRLNG